MIYLHLKVKKIKKYGGKVLTDMVQLLYKNKNKGVYSMASVFDVTKYILNKTGIISTWKLQKLCYYSQAWSLAWTEHPLFEEEIQAWANGPVCPTLFHAHRGKFMVDFSDFSQGDISVLSPDQRDTIDRVLEHYGSWEPFELREQTHQEDPWKNARHDVPDGASCSNTITQDSMGEYYGNL